MRSITWKLIGAFLLVVIVSVGLTAFLVSMSTTNEFRHYVTETNSDYIQIVKNNLEEYYKKNGSWANLQIFLENQLRSNNQRLIVTDSSGVIIGDTEREYIGRRDKEIGLSGSENITGSDKTIGKLYLMCGGTMGGGRMMSWGCTGSGVLRLEEQNFLSRINTYLWAAGIIGVVVALLLGLLLTRQITLPVRDLTKGAHRVAAGDLKYQVKMNSKDELGELAASFNHMASNLDKIEQSRRQLTADIAHELRTPLTVIEGAVNGMIDGVFPADEEHLNWIKEQTALLTRLINDLRDLSLAESGQLKLNLDSIDLADLVHRKVSQINVIAQEKGISLTMKSQDDLPQVKADAERIEQVFANLLANAIRHTPAGGKISVEIKMAGSESFEMLAKNSLLVSVTDTGEGIAEEHIPYIFNRFYRVESSRSRTGSETGLGLAIVKQMIEAHGGRVWIESTVGSGSTIFLLLPVA